MIQHGPAVDGVEASEVAESPLPEVPPAVVGEIFGCDASLCRDDRAEGSGVVAADTVEVDAEDEAAVGGSQNEAPRKLRAASMKPKSFGVT